MKTIILSALFVSFISLFIFQPKTHAAAKLPDFTNDAVVENTLDDIEDKLNELINTAISKLDLMLAQRLKQVNMALQNLRIDVNDDIALGIKQLSTEKKELLNDIERLVDKTYEQISKEIERGDVIFDTKLADICNSLSPIICKDYPYKISYMYGMSQTYKSEGVHEIKIGGSAIDPMVNGYIRVNGKTYTGRNKTDIQNFLIFEIPASDIEAIFKDTELARLPSKITVKKEVEVSRPWWKFFGKNEIKEKKFTINSDLILLPKFPLKYEIVYTYQQKDKLDNCRTLQDRFQNLHSGERWFHFDIKKDELFQEETLKLSPDRWYKAGVQDGWTDHFVTEYDGHPRYSARYFNPGRVGVDTKIEIVACQKVNQEHKAPLYVQDSQASNKMMKKIKEGYLPYGFHVTQHFDNLPDTYNIKLYPYYTSGTESILLTEKRKEKTNSYLTVSIQEEGSNSLRRLNLTITPK